MNNQRTKVRKPKKKVKTMDLILVIIGVTLAVFTIAMIHLFTLYGAIPDTLCACVFSVLGTECGAMAWIKTTKDKQQDRKWRLSDEKRERKANEQAQPQSDDSVCWEENR